MWKSFLLLSCVSSSLFGLASTQDPEPAKSNPIRLEEGAAARRLQQASAERLRAGDLAAARALQEKAAHLRAVADEAPENPFTMLVQRPEDPRAILKRLLEQEKITKQEYAILEGALRGGAASTDAFRQLLELRAKAPAPQERNLFEELVRRQKEQEARVAREVAMAEAERARERGEHERARAIAEGQRHVLQHAQDEAAKVRAREVDVREVFERARQNLAEAQARVGAMDREREALQKAEQRLAQARAKLEEHARSGALRERVGRVEDERRAVAEARARFERDQERARAQAERAQAQAERDRARAERAAEEARERVQDVRETLDRFVVRARPPRRPATGAAEAVDLRAVVERLDGEMKGIRRELEAIHRKLDRLLGSHDVK